MSTRRVIGFMTGTSLDGMDAALIEVQGRGLEMKARFVRGRSAPLGELSLRLRHLAEQHPMRAFEIARLAADFSAAHAALARELLAGERCDLACVHGQTVFHGPPLSLQLMQPAPLAAALGAPVCFDLRQMDLASGGQGAPITPLADAVLLRFAPGQCAVANLGGFCNVTLFTPAGDGAIRPERIQARDVCACNQVLDAVARMVLHQSIDSDGATAAQGKVHEEAMNDLEGVLAAQSGSRRSLGTGDEAVEWVSRFRARVSPPDLAATACEGVAEAVSFATSEAELLLLAGGGVRNKTLVARIKACSSANVQPIDAMGIPAEFREAACFAVLGALCQDRVPITLPQVTGCPGPALISGAWVIP